MSYVYVAHCGSHGLLIFARFKLRFNFHPNIEYSLRPSQVGPPRHREPELAGLLFLAINVAARLAGRRPPTRRFSDFAPRPPTYRGVPFGMFWNTVPDRAVQNRTERSMEGGSVRRLQWVSSTVTVG